MEKEYVVVPLDFKSHRTIALVTIPVSIAIKYILPDPFCTDKEEPL